MQTNSNNRNSNRRTQARRWTREEDDRLLRHVRVFPQNLSRCFHIVAEETGRTPGAVQARWYTHVSKQPDTLCFFTASEHHVSKNRKNGMGVSTRPSLWRRLLNIIRGI
jgi:hypothetical protein